MIYTSAVVVAAATLRARLAVRWALRISKLLGALVTAAVFFLAADAVVSNTALNSFHAPTEPVSSTSLARKGDKFDDWRYHYCAILFNLSVTGMTYKIFRIKGPAGPPVCELVCHDFRSEFEITYQCVGTFNFVDRDIFMRYFGGGPGHYQVKVPQPEADELELSDDEDPEPSEGPVPEAPESEPESEDDPDEDDPSALEDDIPDDSDEKKNDENESDGEEGEGAGELQLGAEDGEDGGDDLAAQLGYDEL
ncbi:hypothetical protein DFH08DRAFT_813011 [Mycena albidolilacea]|uniref:Uncharacterized protein n=1 Tax=Mycena albidolilacea TaxID=1033008 RepID=A0AAD6ZTD8_9AGAR|nr:hypothetical protein DFH08DRAFT_813011 [Mycena albidolilacea]